jgi:hypothetical protein
MLRSSQMYFVPDDVCVPCVRPLKWCSLVGLASLVFWVLVSHFGNSFFFPSVCSVSFMFQRVRHSETISGDQWEFTLMQQMMCTMRVWQKIRGHTSSTDSRSSPNNKNNEYRADGNRSRSLSSPFDSSTMRIPASEFRNMGPELVLTPLSIPLLGVDLQQQQQQQHLCCGSDFSNTLSNKFGSFGSTSPTAERVSRLRLSSSGAIHGVSSTSQHHRLPSIGTVTIPLRDILLASASDTNGSNKNTNSPPHQTTVTTVSAGYYELTMDNLNGQLVLMAFLRANLPKTKLCDLNENLGLPRSPSNMTQTTHSTKSFDVEAFTATRMTERLQSESVAEKVQRRIHRIVTSLEESKYRVRLYGFNRRRKN